MRALHTRYETIFPTCTDHSTIQCLSCDTARSEIRAPSVGSRRRMLRARSNGRSDRHGVQSRLKAVLHTIDDKEKYSCSHCGSRSNQKSIDGLIPKICNECAHVWTTAGSFDSLIPEVCDDRAHPWTMGVLALRLDCDFGRVSCGVTRSFWHVHRCFCCWHLSTSLGVRGCCLLLPRLLTSSPSHTQARGILATADHFSLCDVRPLVIPLAHRQITVSQDCLDSHYSHPQSSIFRGLLLTQNCRSGLYSSVCLGSGSSKSLTTTATTTISSDQCHSSHSMLRGLRREESQGCCC